MEKELRPSVRKYGDGWEGVIRDSKNKIVECCGHWHDNRDQTTRFNGISAIDCAHKLLKEPQ